MALFGFLKRKRGDLDIPPPPPPDIDLTQASDEMQGKKSIHDMSDLKIPDLPDLPDIQRMEEPTHKELEPKPAPKPVLAPRPEIKHEAAPRQVERIVQAKPAAPEMNPEEVHPVPKPEPKKMLETPEHHGPIYMKANYYVDILKNIDAILQKLKTTEEAAKKLTEIKNNKDVEFEKYRNYLEDVQRKTAVMDKTLFGQR